MMAVTKLLAGAAAIGVLASAAPAAAQYYPGYGYGYGGNVVGQVLNNVLGGGYGYSAYGANSQQVVNQCSGAVQARLNRGGYGYGYGYGGGRVLGITRVEPRESGRGLRVWGVASSGGYGGADLTWSCRTDYRGYVVDVDLKRGPAGYGYSNAVPYNGYDYSQYGYRRY